MNPVEMQKVIKKQLTKLWKYVKTPRNSVANGVKEYDEECENAQHQELAEPHLISPPVKPEHSGANKLDHRVEEFLGQNLEFHDSQAEVIYDLELRLSKMAAREAKLLTRLRQAEEALARQTHKRNLDQLSLTMLKEENARLVTKVHMQDEEWQEKFHLLNSLNNVLLREREKAWELERAALKANLANQQTHHNKFQKVFQKNTEWIKRITRRSCHP